MNIVLFIVGIFFIWKGSMKISNKTEAWPKSKKAGRVFGVILLLPLIVELGFFHSINGISLVDNYKTLPAGAPYSNEQYGFKIVPPEGWAVNETKKNGQIVGFAARTKDVQGVIGITFIEEPEVDNSNFDMYISNGTRDIPNTPGATLIGSTKIASSTVSSYLTEFKMKIGDKLVHSLQLSVLAKNGEVFIISGVVDDALWPQFKDVIKNSLMSFSVK